MHKRRRTKEGNPTIAKTPIQGVLERASEGNSSPIKLRALKTTRKTELQSMVREIVKKGSEVMTDSWRSYQGLEGTCVHQVVDHPEAYAKGHVHTNGMENFWSLFKRALKGTYVNVEPFHLFRYCDEQAFRFNERGDTNAGRFVSATAGIFGKCLRYGGAEGQSVEDLGSLWSAARF